MPKKSDSIKNAKTPKLPSHLMIPDGGKLPVLKNRSGNLTDGSENNSGHSRAVVCYMPTLGERIKRYLRSPDLLQQHYNDPDLWDDEDAEVLFNEDGVPISKHEDRYKQGLEEAKKKDAERKAEAKKQADEAEKERKAKFRKDVQDAVKAGETPEFPE